LQKIDFLVVHGRIHGNGKKKLIEENENNTFKIGFLEVDDKAIRL